LTDTLSDDEHTDRSCLKKIFLFVFFEKIEKLLYCWLFMWITNIFAFFDSHFSI
jgi:hypothetical protein